MNTAACVVSLVQEGIRNSERPLFADQLGMQETEHFMDTESVEQNDVPPPVFDRLGMQGNAPPPRFDRFGMREKKQFTDTNSTSMKKKFMRRGVRADLGRSPLLDVKGGAWNLVCAERLQPKTSSPFDLLESSIC